MDRDIERLLDRPDPFFLKSKVIVDLSRDEWNSHSGSGHYFSIVRDEFVYPDHARCSCGTEPVGTLTVQANGRGISIRCFEPEPMPDVATTPSAPSCPICELVGFDCGHSE